MWDLFIFSCGALCGGCAVADWLGFKLAKHGDPFWIGATALLLEDAWRVGHATAAHLMMPVLTSGTVAASRIRQYTATPIDYKDHFLIGLRDDGGGVLLARWPYAPPKKEIDAKIADVQGYLQFAVVNPTGIIAVEKSTTT